MTVQSPPWRAHSPACTGPPIPQPNPAPQVLLGCQGLPPGLEPWAQAAAVDTNTIRSLKFLYFHGVNRCRSGAAPPAPHSGPAPHAAVNRGDTATIQPGGSSMLGGSLLLFGAMRGTQPACSGWGTDQAAAPVQPNSASFFPQTTGDTQPQAAGHGLNPACSSGTLSYKENQAWCNSAAQIAQKRERHQAPQPSPSCCLHIHVLCGMGTVKRDTASSAPLWGLSQAAAGTSTADDATWIWLVVEPECMWREGDQAP